MLFDAVKWQARAGNDCIESVAVDRMIKVLAWCQERDVDVKFVRTNEGVYNPPMNGKRASIIVPIRASIEKELFLLLHELGHHIIQVSGTARTRTSKGYRNPSSGDRDFSMHYRIDLIEEEYEAWHEGELLASSLGIDVDVDRYQRYKAMWITTYIDWAAKRSKE